MQRITIVSRNRPGVLAEITQVLAARGISIESFAAQTFGSDGVLQLGVSAADFDAALGALTAAGYQAVTEDVLLARIEDRPGALAELSRRLRDADVTVRAMNMVQRDDGFAVVAIASSDNARARTVLGSCAL